MALSKEHHSLQMFLSAITHGAPLKNGRWAFLGNQRLRGCPRDNPDPNLWRDWWNMSMPEELPIKLAKSKLHSVKPWLEFFGAECVMFDSNGKDGCIQHDLNLPVEDKYLGSFDVVTNFGTTEHVVPSQMPAFKTIHDLCRPGGYMLHAVPSEGCNRHGDWRYPFAWMVDLALRNSYRRHELYTAPVQHNRGRGPHLYVVALFRKVKNQPFNVESWVDPPQSER